MKDIISKLNKLFESRIRLGVMSVLMVNDTIDFNALKELLNVTDGNLASHLASLEKNDFIQVHKQFVGKKPRTTYSATQKGIKAFKDHMEALEALLKSQN